MGGPRARPRRSIRAAVVVAVLLGAALRLHPVHRPYWSPEFQERYPHDALVALVRGDWRPFDFVHGAGLLDVLRALFTVQYAGGRALGAYYDRIDVLAAFVRDPFPFVVVGRVVVWLFGTLGIALAAVLARDLFGPSEAPVAALLLAVSFIDVRATHQIWPDGPGAVGAAAAAIGALRALRRPGTAPAALAGALAGVAVGLKHSALPVVLSAALAATLGPIRAPGAILRRLAAMLLCAGATYLALSPYTALAFHDTVVQMSMQSHATFAFGATAVPPVEQIRLALGVPLMALAIVGLVAAAFRSPAPAAVAAVYPLAYLVILLRARNGFVRYAVALAPFAAVFAAHGAIVIGRGLGRWLARPWPRVAAAALVVTAAWEPALRSVRYDALLARDDTRRLAADWIEAHVPPGTRLTLPDLLRYPNPILPRNADDLRWEYSAWHEALRARGLGDPARTYPAGYLRRWGTPVPGWEELRPRFVVTGSHPAVLTMMNPPAAALAALQAVGARVVAEFDGVPDPLPPGVVYDRHEADYLPLAGFGAVARPGPNITIWEVPWR